MLDSYKMLAEVSPLRVEVLIQLRVRDIFTLDDILYRSMWRRHS